MNIDTINPGRPAQGPARSESKSGPPIDTAGHASKGVPHGVGAQSVVGRINYMKQQLDEILVSYPPFFPAGSPQRPDLIRKIRGIQDDIGTLSGTEGKAVTDMNAKKLPEHATDKDISRAIEDLLRSAKEIGRNVPLPVKSQPGTLLHIKI